MKNLDVYVFGRGILLQLACKGGVYIPLAGVIAMVLWEMFKPFKEKIKYVIGVAIPFILVFIAQFSQRILSLFMRQPGSAYRSGEEIYNISYFIEKPNQFIRIFQNTIVTSLVT